MTDDVRGTVIGDVTTDLYITFHDRLTGEQVIPGAWYKSEQDAVDHVRKNWLTLYQVGLEMRVHD